jgi:hypothetical protein
MQLDYARRHFTHPALSGTEQVRANSTSSEGEDGLPLLHGSKFPPGR